MPLFILENWKILIIGAIVLALSVTAMLYSHALHSCQADKERISVAYQVIATKVAEQNAAIAKLGDAAKLAEARHAEAIKKASSIVAATKSKKVSLAAITAPSSTDCDVQMGAINDLLNKGRE